MKTDREKRPVFCTVTGAGLSPATSADAEALDRYKHGSVVEVTIKQRRSLPALQAYWAGLYDACEAMDSYPSAEHLHDAIKMELGLTTPVKRLDGTIEYHPDSVALSRMDNAEFKEFFKRAQRLFITAFGFDPWEANK